MPIRLLILLLGGLSLLSLSACSIKATLNQTTDTTSNITGSTSGRAWWNEDGMLKQEHKIAAFTTYNADNLASDMARGQGEYFASLQALHQRSENTDAQAAAQDAYGRWSRSGSTSPDALVTHWQSLTR